MIISSDQHRLSFRQGRNCDHTSHKPCDCTLSARSLTQSFHYVFSVYICVCVTRLIVRFTYNTLLRALPVTPLSPCDAPVISRYTHTSRRETLYPYIKLLIFERGPGFGPELFLSRPQYGILRTGILG